MHPLSDKDLDRLSREAAEQYDVDQSPSGWEHLEQRLDQELPLKRKRQKTFLMDLLFIPLLSGSGLVWMLADNEPEMQILLSVNFRSDNDVKTPDSLTMFPNPTVPGNKRMKLLSRIRP